MITHFGNQAEILKYNSHGSSVIRNLPFLYCFGRIIANIMVTHEHDLVRAFQRRVIVIKNGEVVSDTPDPTHAQFDSEETEKSTDMFFYNEDIKLGEEVEDIFDSIDDFGTKTTSETNADIKNGGEE